MLDRSAPGGGPNAPQALELVSFDGCTGCEASDQGMLTMSSRPIGSLAAYFKRNWSVTAVNWWYPVSFLLVVLLPSSSKTMKSRTSTKKRLWSKTLSISNRGPGMVAGASSSPSMVCQGLNHFPTGSERTVQRLNTIGDDKPPGH